MTFEELLKYKLEEINEKSVGGVEINTDLITKKNMTKNQENLYFLGHVNQDGNVSIYQKKNPINRTSFHAAKSLKMGMGGLKDIVVFLHKAFLKIFPEHSEIVNNRKNNATTIIAKWLINNKDDLMDKKNNSRPEFSGNLAPDKGFIDWIKGAKKK